MRKLLIRIILTLFAFNFIHGDHGLRSEIESSIDPAYLFRNVSDIFDKPFHKRYGEVPEVIRQRWETEDQGLVEGIVYEKYNMSAKEAEQLEGYLKLLPKLIVDRIDDAFLGVFPVKGLYGGGLVALAFDENHKLYTYILFNSDLFNYSCSEWLTKRISTCFKKDEKAYVLTADISDSHPALLYILFHELGHVYDRNVRVSPPDPYVRRLSKFLGDPLSDELIDFGKGVWERENTLNQENTILGGMNFNFYGLSEKKEVYPNEMILEVYQAFKNTKLSSLYGSKFIGEDFAELFAMELIHEKLGLEYTVVITKKGEDLFRYTPMRDDSIRGRVLKFIR